MTKKEIKVIMDCNSYSSAPDMLTDYPRKNAPEMYDKVTVERRYCNGRTYYSVYTDTGFNKCYDINDAFELARELMAGK